MYFRGMKFILIEDEGSLRDLYKREFEAKGFALEGFATGKEGLAAIRNGKYDVVLLDIMLPDIDGLEVLKRIKEDAKTQNLPVILLTNLGQDKVIKDGFAMGANGYFVKAHYSIQEIVDAVVKLLKEKHPGLFKN